MAFELNQPNRQREIKALLTTMKELKLKEGLVLTHGQEGKIVEKRLTIKIMPLWKWVLETGKK